MAQKLSDYTPALKFGAKIYPEDLAGMIGLPSVGNIYYVDAGNGSDTANSGTSADEAFATVYKAQSVMTADQDDVCIIVGSTSTGRTSETQAINWNKRRTHLVGNGPARKINPRQGVGFAALGGDVCFTVSARNCLFANISIATFADNNILVDVTDDYNTFVNVHFQGIGDATAGADTAARCLRLNGAEENEFYNCTIGLDTVARSAVNASLEATGTCARNKFYNCDFLIFTSDAGAVHVKADTGNAYERFLIFDHCAFLNADTASSTTLTVNMDLSATGNGTVFLFDSWSKGATDWTNTFTNLFLTMPVADSDEGGLSKIGS